MKTLTTTIICLLLTIAAFGQALPNTADVTLKGGHYLAPSVSLGITSNTSVAFDRYDVHGVQGYVLYKFADATVNDKSVLQLHVLAGGASDGFIGGLMLGEKHEDFYWNVIAGNVYRIAGGMKIPSYKDLVVSAQWGKRGYGADLEYKLVKKPIAFADGLAVTAGWNNSLGVNISIKTTLVFSE